MSTAARYELSNPEAAFEGKGQAALVHEILKSGPKLVKEIETALVADPRFKTRQDPLRIAAYYVCVFKKSGVVRSVTAAAPAVDAEVPAEGMAAAFAE